MTNIEKLRIIESMSKAYSAKEISERTGLSLNSIYHFRKKYNLPTEKDTQEVIEERALRQMQIDTMLARKLALEEATITLND